MQEISGSFSTGRVAYLHDLRDKDHLPGNVDKSKTADNVILCDNLTQPDGTVISPQEWIDRQMQPIIDKYNAGQKRADRKITVPYHEYHTAKVGTDLCKESVMQIGEHDTTGKAYFDKMAKGQKIYHDCYTQVYAAMLQKLQEKYPHIKVIYAAVHFDETRGTPHMHVCYTGIGDDFKRGLPTRVSISRALQQDGVERLKTRSEGKEGFQLARWYREVHAQIIKPELVNQRSVIVMNRQTGEKRHAGWIDRLLRDATEVKAYKGGQHIDSRLMPDVEAHKQRLLQKAREDVQPDIDAMHQLADAAAETRRDVDNLDEQLRGMECPDFVTVKRRGLFRRREEIVVTDPERLLGTMQKAVTAAEVAQNAAERAQDAAEATDATLSGQIARTAREELEKERAARRKAEERARTAEKAVEGRDAEIARLQYQTNRQERLLTKYGIRELEQQQDLSR